MGKLLSVLPVSDRICKAKDHIYSQAERMKDKTPTHKNLDMYLLQQIRGPSLKEIDISKSGPSTSHPHQGLYTWALTGSSGQIPEGTVFKKYTLDAVPGIKTSSIPPKASPEYTILILNNFSENTAHLSKMFVSQLRERKLFKTILV